MTSWTYFGKSGFGLADIKHEGKKLGPATYLYMNGRYPPMTFYTTEELLKLKQEGWEPNDQTLRNP